ncbi:MAG: cytochrome c-type biogenesis protein CcsB [Alpinimonas sp.]|jgi:cytochrome c-type biogenesis protein CcsB
MAIYALAFILFTIDLARGAGDDATVKGSKLPRIAMALTVLAFVVQLAATLMRGFAASRVPWANMYEFAMTGTLIIVAVFLVVNIKLDLRFIGTFVTGFALLFLGLASTRYYVEVVPLPPALQSYWLVIHVFVATLGTGFFALGFALSLAQLLQHKRESANTAALVASAAAVTTNATATATATGVATPAPKPARRSRLEFLKRLPDSIQLENHAYRLIIIGFIFWTFTLIAGAVWAEKAWGRYWGWDTKEVWTFIIWTIYAGYIHARSTRGWRGTRSAWLAMVGFAAVMFNFTIVNIFFKGLHVYSGL